RPGSLRRRSRRRLENIATRGALPPRLGRGWCPRIRVARSSGRGGFGGSGRWETRGGRSRSARRRPIGGGFARGGCAEQVVRRGCGGFRRRGEWKQASSALKEIYSCVLL